MEKLLSRFLRYIQVDTQSDAALSCCPSTPGQMNLANLIKEELLALGLEEVSLDENGYLIAKLPSNLPDDHPSVSPIGFIAHMDTAPDASGANVTPQLVENYQGGDIALGIGDEVLSPIRYPELHNLIGHNLITTDGTTLLGADNKAGIAEIVSAVALLKAKPELLHGDIWIGFTPDEEIGRGADKFDVESFGAEWAYTIDGGPVGELQYENFNAAAARINFKGISVHPGTAKSKLVNAQNMASDFHQMIPRDEMPETTEGYEGFYHLATQSGSVTNATLNYILRDFDAQGLATRKAYIEQCAAQIRQKFKHGEVDVLITDNYANMREQVEQYPHIIEIAKSAMEQADVEPLVKPIRGGTDGARLSYMGLPCPNVFTGGYNFHGIHEFITIEGMVKAVDVIINIATLTAERAR
ncbi:peptidase T [Thaumasiovibrio subtropicus]|uniref:peptidase T n=1 Tax=Thaumasiovibrio subtropicus TaxID=1891207 RepID=UPI000B3570EC|nr:peptidase T [Thaumasiovibrio subtropicus]